MAATRGVSNTTPQQDEDSRESCDSQNQFPSSIGTPAKPLAADDPNLTALRLVVREEMSGDNQRLSEQLGHIKEIGPRVHDLENAITDTTTVLDGHENDIGRLQQELSVLYDKTEDI